MTRHLIADRSCQQTTSKSERSPSQTEGESTACELEKSGLSNEYNFDCAEVQASTNDTIGVTHTPAFNFDQLDLGLAEFSDLGCVFFNAASTALATATRIQNENEIKQMKVDKMGHVQTQTQNSSNCTSN